MRTTPTIPQADGGDRPTVTPCDRHPDRAATTFVSARHYGVYRCNLPGCADQTIADLQADPALAPTLAYVIISRKAAA